MEDLEWFHDTWLDAARTDPTCTLIITYGELTRDPTATVNRIEDFFDLKRSAQVKLKRKRYSRSSPLQACMEICVKAIRALIRHAARFAYLSGGKQEGG